MIVKGKVDVMAWHGSLGATISTVCRLVCLLLLKHDENLEFGMDRSSSCLLCFYRLLVGA